MPRTNNVARVVYSINDVGTLYTHTEKKCIWTLSHTIHKSNSKWIKGLTIRPEAVKLQEGNWENFLD